MILIENESCKNDNTILTDASYNIYLKFRQLIEDNFKKVHIVGEYVSMMNISLPILTKAVNRYAQASPLQLIHERIILEAKRMLSTTSLRIKEISAILGFEDSSYFVKFFKRNEHISPVEFRERF